MGTKYRLFPRLHLSFSRIMDQPYNECVFVGDAILELSRDNRIAEVFSSPDIVNPFSVSVQSSGKERLILDLRH